MNETEHEIDNIKHLLQLLIAMLNRHEGRNFISGVISLVDAVSEPEKPARERISYGCEIYRRLLGGMGTLGDFVIWDESEMRRMALNNELENILTVLWKALEC